MIRGEASAVRVWSPWHSPPAGERHLRLTFSARSATLNA